MHANSSSLTRLAHQRLVASLPGVCLLLAAIAAPLRAATADATFWPSTPAAQWLGLNESTLPAAVPEIQRLRRPQIGPHGLKAWWALPGVPLDQGRLDTLFFTRNQAVVHIEERWRAEPTRCQAGSRYQALVARLNQRLGQTGVANGDAQGPQASTAWAAGAYDVRLYLNQMAGNCQLLLVHEVHAERDPSEL
ncbi:hypothetical protein [Curvibacter gracilis]|uniref:hypothetical protein n=1 Tax=Curvibacter gracilis TaxID=230310 RepID=UPI000486CEEB|nr:hypothetical protein [Curvibacter gracilis]